MMMMMISRSCIFQPASPDFLHLEQSALEIDGRAVVRCGVFVLPVTALNSSYMQPFAIVAILTRDVQIDETATADSLAFPKLRAQPSCIPRT